MSKVIMRDEDSQVIHMVNTHTAYRRRKAEEAREVLEIREEDTRVRDTDFMKRKQQLIRVTEAAGKAMLGLGFVAAVQFGFVVDWMGVVMGLVCFAWAAASWKRGKA